MIQHSPKIATFKSIKVLVEKNKTYLWCSCGLSEAQPFCDGSHKGSTFSPVEYTADEDKIIGFCGCKYTEKAPLCDGSHKNLTEIQNETL